MTMILELLSYDIGLSQTDMVSDHFGLLLNYSDVLSGWLQKATPSPPDNGFWDGSIAVT